MNVIVVFLFSLFLTQQACAGNASFKQTTTDVDKVINQFNSKCQLHASDKIVLSISDTLLNYAQKHNSPSGLILAYIAKVNYYVYYPNNDSLKKYTDKGKELSKKIGDNYHYYYIWGQYIYSNIYSHHFSLALNEERGMFKEARSSNYMPGVADCYSQLALIYNMQNLYHLSAFYMKKCINIIERYKIDDFNNSISYYYMANYLIGDNRADEAYPYIMKGYKCAAVGRQRLYLMDAEMHYWQIKKNKTKIKNILSQMKTINDPSASLFIVDGDELWYEVVGDYRNAVAKMDEMYKIGGYDESEYYRDKYSLLKKMGKKDEAYAYLDKYVKLQDSLRLQSAKVDLADFTTILDQSSVNRRNQELQLSIQKNKLTSTYIIIGVLMILFFTSFFFLHRQRRLTRALIKSSDDLKHEKELAEKANRMKTTFINNMSHEIRTPLNSIVGFSDVLNGMYDKNEDTKDLVAQIVKGTNNLTRIVDDLLALSSMLSDDASEVKLSPVGINSICDTCINRVKGKVSPEVKIFFNPWGNEKIIITNIFYVTNIISKLLDNAVKFTTKGSISVDCNYLVEKNELWVTVTDTGPGIPLDRQEWVFDKFNKVDDFKQGAGIGLTMARTGARKLGGNVKIDSSYTSGTRISLILPVTLA